MVGLTEGSMVVLASSSPRRAGILRRIGIEPVLSPADVDETPHVGETAVALVERLAKAKAEAGWDRYRRSEESGDAVAGRRLVVAADTVVEVDGRVMGKPEGESDAVSMLNALSGRTHRVVTGLSVGRADRMEEPLTEMVSAVETTTVSIRPLDDDLIRWYVGTGEPLDKAGAYGIQGAGCLLADHVDGSYLNVVGLPVVALDDLCRRLGWPLHRLADHGWSGPSGAGDGSSVGVAAG